MRLTRAIFPSGVLGLVFATLLGACAPALQQVRDGEFVVHSIVINFNNAHLVSGRHGAFLVDAGLAADAPALAQRIQGLGVDPASLKAVIITHGHADHAGGAHYFQQQYKVPIVAGAADSAMLAAGANDRLCPSDFIARRLHAEAQAATYPKTTADRQVDRRVSLAAATGIEGLPGYAIPIPGHTPGSLVVVLGELAFVGDLFRGGLLGSGAVEHFFMCDPASNRRDIRAFLDRDGRAVRRFFTGHFGPVSREEVIAMVRGFPRDEVRP